jgi:hypothetical protein
MDLPAPSWPALCRPSTLSDSVINSLIRISLYLPLLKLDMMCSRGWTPGHDDLSRPRINKTTATAIRAKNRQFLDKPMSWCYGFSELDANARSRFASASGLARPTPLIDSEMAPQALEKAQNGLGNGALGSPMPRGRTDRPNSHQFGDLEEEPAKGRQADGPEKHDGPHGVPGLMKHPGEQR